MEFNNFTKIMLYTLLFLFIVFGVVLIWFYYNNKNEINQLDADVVEIKINGKEFKLKIADTYKKRQEGLMNVRNMPQDEGMLFVFKTSGIYSFWMKDTLIPLDIIWLNKDGEVVFIKHEAKPCSNIVEAVCKSIVPNKMAKYVIELNAGVVDEIGLIKKDKIDIDSILN